MGLKNYNPPFTCETIKDKTFHYCFNFFKVGKERKKESIFLPNVSNQICV